MLAASFTPATAMEYFVAHWEVRAQTRARAMRRLSIPPAGEGLRWGDYFPVVLVVPEANLFNQFQPFSAATSEAERFLTERGVKIPTRHGLEVATA